MPLEHQQFEADVDKYFGNLPSNSFELSQCIFCQTSEKSRALFKKGSMVIVRCDCGFTYNQRQATRSTLTKFYQASDAMSTWSNLKNSEKEIDRQNSKFRASVEYILSSNIKSVLDIGCGTGFFLRLITNKNPKIFCHGIDYGIDNIFRGGIVFQNMGYEEFFYFNERTFDCISLWGVLEHVKDPMDILSKARLSLSDDGTILICVPNCNSRVVQTLFDKCFTFCPQHLWYFNFDSLARLLRKTGFEVEKWFTIEPESMPIEKYNQGLDPYGPAGPGHNPALDQEIIFNNQGYKIVLMAKKI